MDHSRHRVSAVDNISEVIRRASSAAATLLLTAAVLAAPSMASAQCTSAAQQAIVQAAQANQANQQILGNALSNMANYAAQNDGNDVVSVCSTQSFPTSMFGTSQIVSNIARQIIDKACAQARAAAQQKLGPTLNKMSTLQTMVGNIQANP